VLSDPYAMRVEVERLVGEDRVPAEVLERLLADYGDGPPRAEPRRALNRRVAAAISSVRRRARRAARRPRRPGLETPAALRLDGAEAIDVLCNAAHDSELAMLDELVERGGLGWKCQAEIADFPCHYMNVGTTTCGGCGAGEAQGKEKGDG
jgi:hypothetical protein